MTAKLEIEVVESQSQRPAPPSVHHEAASTPISSDGAGGAAGPTRSQAPDQRDDERLANKLVDQLSSDSEKHVTALKDISRLLAKGLINDEQAAALADRAVSVDTPSIMDTATTLAGNIPGFGPALQVMLIAKQAFDQLSKVSEVTKAKKEALAVTKVPEGIALDGEVPEGVMLPEVPDADTFIDQGESDMFLPEAPGFGGETVIDHDDSDLTIGEEEAETAAMLAGRSGKSDPNAKETYIDHGEPDDLVLKPAEKVVSKRGPDNKFTGDFEVHELPDDRISDAAPSIDVNDLFPPGFTPAVEESSDSMLEAAESAQLLSEALSEAADRSSEDAMEPPGAPSAPAVDVDDQGSGVGVDVSPGLPVPRGAGKKVAGKAIPTGRAVSGIAARGATSAVGAVGGAGAGAAAGGGAAAAGGLMAAAGPVGIVLAAVAAAGTVAVFALKKFADAMEAEANRMQDFSGEVAAAVDITNVRREMANLRRGQELGSELAQFERGRARIEERLFDINTEIKEAILEIANDLMPMVEAILPFIETGADQLMLIVRILRSIHLLQTGQIDEFKKNNAEITKILGDWFTAWDERGKDDILNDPFMDQVFGLFGGQQAFGPQAQPRPNPQQMGI